jgi:hypothetical protein
MLFEIDPGSPKLNETRSEIFHSIVAKQLYVSHRGRPDVQLPIAFLCTRVSKSTEQDWSKLKRVLEFLEGTLDDRITLGADDITVMQTWVDASYAVHSDMKSHTGGTVSFGRGSLMSKSSKQKLNTKSSTKAELVGASDYLPYAIWAKKFLKHQGYTIRENSFHQDNKSTIQFEKNGRKSCGPNSRHIDIRYFWIKNRLELDGFNVVYCSTERMLADFSTKPLQGALFRKLRAVVMGHAHVRTLLSIEDKSATIIAPTVVPPALAQERVGQNEGEGPKDRDQDHKVRFKLNPGARTTDGKKSQATTATEKITPAIGRSYADVAREATRKIGVVSKSMRRVLLTL